MTGRNGKASFISAILMTVIITFAATGFSYSVHFCHGRVADYSLFSGYNHSLPGCGCKDDAELVCQPHSQPSHTGIDKVDCCKNKHLYYKLHIQSLTEITGYTDNIQCNQTVHVNSGLFDSLQNLTVEETASPPDKDVSVTGVSLVLLFHQIRIPLQSGDC